MTVVEFILIAVALVLDCIALGVMYWTLVLSATAVFLLVQGLVLINLYRGERDDH